MERWLLKSKTRVSSILCTIGILLLIWHTISIRFNIPTIVDIFEYLKKLNFILILKHLSITLTNTITGFLFGLTLAFLVAILSTINDFFKEVIVYISSIFNSVSPLIWVLVVILMFGVLNPISPILVVTFYTFPILLSNFVEGIKSIDTKFNELAQVLRLSKITYVKDIVLPALTPYLLSNFRLGIGGGFRISVLAEAFGQSGGLGYMIMYNYYYMDFTGVLTWGLITVISMVLIEVFIIKLVESISYKWHILS